MANLGDVVREADYEPVEGPLALPAPDADRVPEPETVEAPA